MTVDTDHFTDTLPTYLTRFVGRDREIATVLSMLHPGQLVTICGVGGAGKTRLAIEVAKRSRARWGSTKDGGETSDALRVSSHEGLWLVERRGFGVEDAFAEAVVEAADESVEEVALRRSVPVSCGAAPVVVSARSRRGGEGGEGP